MTEYNKILVNLYNNGILKKRRLWFERNVFENYDILLRLYDACPKKAEIYISSTKFSFNFYDDLGLEIVGSVMVLGKNRLYAFYDDYYSRESIHTNSMKEACLWLLKKMK